MPSDTTQEALQACKMWITGGGKATDKDLVEARKEVEKAGGRILPHKGKAGVIKVQGCDIEHWDALCEDVQKEFRLSDEEASALKGAKHCDEREVFVVEDLPAGVEHSTRIVAYRTVRDASDKKVHMVYARHEASMQTSCEPIGFPLDLCVKMGSRIFTALPATTPHCQTVSGDMKDQPFALPSGWTVVAADDKDFDSILRDVVAAYHWGTTRLVVKGSEQEPWKAYYTACHSDAGKPYEMTWFKALGEGEYVFTCNSARLLIEAAPSHSAQSAHLIGAWKRYAEISAHAEWGSRLQARRGE